jgi:acylphosphatase
MEVRKHIFFSGRVQGVGFRYRSLYIARTLELTGWVRNCYDDRVEMEVQGLEVHIDNLVLQLKDQRFIQIDEIEMENIPLKQEHDFVVFE